ncbi:hypothetical protein B0H13DRAFT_2347386 [Mycena leptocephala]|nr:hypothetical protein B0H13DRAFT_2347386 [Mycena leptocephala]
MLLPHASNAYPRTPVRLIFSPSVLGLALFPQDPGAEPPGTGIRRCLAVSYSGGITSAQAADPKRYARRRRRSFFSHPHH